MIRRAFRNDYALSLFGKAYTIALGVLSSAFLTRYLGLALRGEYAYVVQVAGILALVLDLGLTQTYSYFYRLHDGDIISRFLGLYARQFAVHLAVAAVVMVVTREFPYALIALLVPFSVLRMQMEATLGVENIRLKIWVNVFCVSASALVYTALFLLSSQVGVSLILPVLATVTVNAGAVFIYLRLSGASIRRASVSLEFARDAVRFSWIPMVTIVLVTLNYGVDILLLKHLGTPVELSLYAVAAGIVGYVFFIPDAFKEVLVSRVARSDAVTSVNLAMKLSLAAVAVIVVLFAALGRIALIVLFGVEFAAAYGVTMVLLLGVFGMVLYKIVGVLFLAEGRRRFYFWALAASVIVNVCLNLIAIPVLGMYGAALASVASYSLCGCLFLGAYLHSRGIRLSSAVLLTRDDILGLRARLREAGTTWEES